MVTIIIGLSILFVIQIGMYIKIGQQITYNYRKLYHQLHSIQDDRVDLKKKMSDLHHEIAQLERIFKQSQSEIFKWQESLQGQINKSKSSKA